MGKYTKMSQQVLEKVGGLSNITFVERCANTAAHPLRQQVQGGCGSHQGH